MSAIMDGVLERIVTRIREQIVFDSSVNIEDLPALLAQYIEHSQELLVRTAAERDEWRAKYYAAIGQADPDRAGIAAVEAVPS